MLTKKLALPLMGLAMLAVALTACYPVHQRNDTVYPAKGYHYVAIDHSTPAGLYSVSGIIVSGQLYNTASNAWGSANAFPYGGTENGVTLYSTSNGTDMELKQYNCGWNYYVWNVNPSVDTANSWASGQCQFLGSV